MLFDTHAHYDDEAFDPDRREVLAGLPQKGVGLVVDPGCTLTSSEKAVALAVEFPHVYAAVGLHPENCHDFQPEQIEHLRQLARREKVESSDWTTTGRRTRPAPCSRRCCGGSWRWRRN